MAADDGRSCATHVCNLCKARKKKCDKQLPRCSYCVKSDQRCVYEPLPQTRATQQQRQQQLPAGATTPPSSGSAVAGLSPALTIASGVSMSAANLHHQVYQLIRASGQFVDDVSARYFRGLHLYIPIVSRPRFHNSLVALGATPSADFSVLLLSIHLVTLPPPPTIDDHQQQQSSSNHNQYHSRVGSRGSNRGSGPIRGPQSLYLTTKALFIQVQSSTFPPSIHLIQAGLLIALYEYKSGQPDQAFFTVSLCARLAYAARIHPCPGDLSGLDHYSDQTQAREAANTWWGIAIYERSFLCEVADPSQPLMTSMPEPDAALPTESHLLELSDAELGSGFLGHDDEVQQQQQQQPYVSSSSLSVLKQADIGAFGRAAQAARLLDRVLKGFGIASLDARLVYLRGLDEELRMFLSELVQQANGKRGPVCQAIALVIRALFTLHGHILDRIDRRPGPGDNQLAREMCQISHAALKSTTIIVIDVVEAHDSSGSLLSSTPSYPYIVRAALEYVEERQTGGEDSSLLGAAQRLRRSMEQMNRQGSHVFS